MKKTGQLASPAKVLEGVVKSGEFISAATSKSQDIVLLDVRSYEEVEQGVIPGALTIPADEVSDRIAEIPAGKQIFIYCKSGIRAEMVYFLLKEKRISAKYLNDNVYIEKDGSFMIEENTSNQ